MAIDNNLGHSVEEEPAMSDDNNAEAAPQENRVNLATFAKSLRPRKIQVPNSSRPGEMRTKLIAGHADEVYLKLLKIEHGRQSHTPSDWQALINAMKNRPAHPLHPQLAQGA